MYPIAFARKLLHRTTPVLFTFHESEFLKPPGIKDETADALKRLVYSRRIKRAALDLADLAIPVWEGLTRELGYTGDQVVLPCGTDVELFRPMDATMCRREIGVEDGERVVFFPAYIFGVGSKRQFKGIDLFEAAVDRVTREVDGVRVITGGSIPRRSMPHHMNAADAVVQTSAFEASPMVIKEAMACNAPIVSLDVGDTRDVVGDTPGCYIVEPDAKAVATAITTAMEHGRTAGRERLLALGLDMDKIARRLVEVYENSLTRYGARDAA
jgi:glycosyltransferase involved in cell wall biosynthesis